MNPYRQGQQPLRRFRLTLSVWYTVVILSCSTQGVGLKGSWVSTEITHPSPFFAETLAEDTHKPVSLFFDQAGGFMRLDHKGVCHWGTYLVQNDTLVLTETQGTPIAIGYTLGKDRLQLKSPDGFTFEFRKASEVDHPGTRPCKP